MEMISYSSILNQWPKNLVVPGASNRLSDVVDCPLLHGVVLFVIQDLGFRDFVIVAPGHAAVLILQLALLSAFTSTDGCVISDDGKHAAVNARIQSAKRATFRRCS